MAFVYMIRYLDQRVSADYSQTVASGIHDERGQLPGTGARLRRSGEDFPLCRPREIERAEIGKGMHEANASEDDHPIAHRVIRCGGFLSRRQSRGRELRPLRSPPEIENPCVRTRIPVGIPASEDDDAIPDGIVDPACPHEIRTRRRERNLGPSSCDELVRPQGAVERAPAEQQSVATGIEYGHMPATARRSHLVPARDQGLPLECRRKNEPGAPR